MCDALNWIAMDTQRLVIFTQSLVRERGLSGEERNVVELILAEMRALGFDQAWADANGSAIGVIEGAKPGQTILLDAHCDTVGVAPGSQWMRDPFGAEIVGDDLYGRGSADMKGALAAMIYGAASVDRARLNRGGRGRAEIHLETIGRPAHSSSPHLGVNAVHKMMAVVNAVERLPLPSDPLLGPALLALTDIISDPYPAYSVIPSRCRVTYDRRLLPGETHDGVLNAIKSLPEVAEVQLNAIIADGEHQTYTGAMLRGPKFFPAWAFPEEHPFVQSALRALRAAGLSPRIGAYRFCTNAAYSAGVAGVPTVGFGPAAEGDAHVVDERLNLNDLFAAARGYRGMVEATLGMA